MKIQKKSIKLESPTSQDGYDPDNLTYVEDEEI